MKKIFVLVLLITVAVLPAAFAAETLDWGSALHSGPSACPDGSLVLNVTQKVVNAVDSGTTRPVWAFDDYIRQIRVVDTGSGLCATVKYEGNFTSIAGDSPGAAYNLGGAIDDGVVGTFQGGYVSTLFAGDLKSGIRTKGSIGTYDYQCDSSGVCPGFVSWPGIFFDNLAGFDIGGWWGWVYHAGNNGSWQNACASCGGNSGDITGD